MTLNNLADLYRTQALYIKAEPLYLRALAILEKVLGPAHPEVARVVNNLATLRYAQGNYGQAELLLKRALTIRDKVQEERSLAIREKVLGPDDPALAETLRDCASVLRKMKQKSEAAAMEARAKAIYGRCGPTCQTDHTVDVLAPSSVGRQSSAVKE